MKKIEFEEVLKSVGIEHPTYIAYLPKGPTSVYRLKGLNIYHEDNVLVQGRVPFEVAKVVRQKYPEGCFVRINGIKVANFDPKNEAVDDLYLKDIKSIIRQKNYLSCAQFTKMLNLAKKRLDSRDDSNKYIKGYGFNKKEAFLYFLLQEKDFILRKNNLPESEVSKFEEIKKELYLNIIKKVDPTISPYNWMLQDNLNYNYYCQSNERIDNNNHLSIIKELLCEFDEAINPFMNNRIDPDEAMSIDDLYVAGDVGVDYIDSENKRDNCGFLTIYANRRNFGVSYHREPDGYIMSLQYNITKGGRLYISHSFASNCADEDYNGEKVHIVSRDEYDYRDYEIDVNLTKGTFKYNDGSQVLVSTYECSKIVDFIKLGIRYANSMLYDKIIGCPKVKQIL